MYFAGDDCKIDMYYVVGRGIKVWVLCLDLRRGLCGCGSFWIPGVRVR